MANNSNSPYVKYPREMAINIYDDGGDEMTRYIIGEVPELLEGEQKLFVVIGMNPSVANRSLSDRTVNSLIKHYDILKAEDNDYVGWILFNLYPERVTNLNQDSFTKHDLAERNPAERNADIVIELLRGDNVDFPYISVAHITEICLVYGRRAEPQLQDGRHHLLTRLLEEFPDMQYYTYGALNRDGSPKHPIGSNWRGRRELRLEKSVRVIENIPLLRGQSAP